MMVIYMIEFMKFLSTLEVKKVKINKILIENYKYMIENPDFEQGYWSRTAIGIYKMGHDTIRLMKSLAYYDRFYHENNKDYDLLASILHCLKSWYFR